MTDTDRELLEQNCELLALAANAAGYTLGMWIDGGEPYSGGPGWIINDRLWNPLTDDGDALRLAVKIDLELYQGDNDGTAVFAGYWQKLRSGEVARLYCIQHVGDDPYAATRLAIVRAAAEIGRNMP